MEPAKDVLARMIVALEDITQIHTLSHDPMLFAV